MVPIESGKYTLHSLDSALRVLDILRTRSDVGVSELSRLSGLGKSSVYNILATLERRSYVRKALDAKYSLGSKFFDNGGAAESSKDLIEIASPIVIRLAKKIGTTIGLGVLNANGRMIGLLSEEGTAPGSPPRRVGAEGEAHSFSTGKVLLAYLEPPVFQAIFAHKQLKQYTPSTIISLKELGRALEEIREAEYAVDIDERYMGYSSISVPLFDKGKRCMAALTAVATSSVFKRDRDIFLDYLQKASREISFEL